MPNGVAVSLPRTLGKRLGSLPIAIGGALGFVLAYGLLHAWKVTFGYVFLHMANVQLAIPHVTTFRPFGWLRGVNAAIEEGLNDVQRYGEKGMVWGFNNFIQLPLLLAGVALALSLAIFELGEWTTTYLTRHLPRTITHTIVRPIVRPVASGVARVTAQIRAVARRLDALSARVAHIVKAVPHAISTTIPRVGRLERQAIDYAKLHRWLKRGMLGALGATVVLTALKRLGLGWTRCTKVGKVGKFICRDLDSRLLSSLLLDVAALTVAFNLRTFAQELQDVTEEAAELIHDFTT